MHAPLFSRVTLLVMAATLAGVALAAGLGGGAMFSPGQLHAGDSTVTTLGGVTSHAALGHDCAACHAAPWSTVRMADRCLACHEDTRAELGDSTALHGALDDPRNCLACHDEHLGATARLTRFTGFTVAHGQLGFPLDAHQTTAGGRPFGCGDCHGGDSFRLEPARCESCHREYQPAFVTAHLRDWGTDCRSCHDGTDRFSRGRFSHDTTGLRLDGAHSKAACADCHTGVTTLPGFARAPSDCAGCHARDDEHRGEFGRDCGACHDTRSWEGARIRHDVFPINHGSRRPSPCSTCHENRANYKQYTCYGCHEHSRDRVIRQHRGEVRTTNLDNCIRCHEGGREHGGHEGWGGDDD